MTARLSARFNAREIFPHKLDRLYRVYATATGLTLIRIGGQNWGFAFSLETQVPLFGKLLARPLRSRALRNLTEAIANADAMGEAFMLTQHPQNSAVEAANIASSTLRHPRAMAHGPCLAIWELESSSGSKRRFQLETATDLAEALTCLADTLGARHGARDL